MLFRNGSIVGFYGLLSVLVSISRLIEALSNVTSQTEIVIAPSRPSLSENVQGNFYGSAVTADDEFPRESNRGLPAQLNRTRSQEYFELEVPPGRLAVLRPPECRLRVNNCNLVPPSILTYLNSVDVKINYDFIVESDIAETLSVLRAAERLRYHEACWNVVQPLIYAVAVPKCVAEERRLIPTQSCSEITSTCGPDVLASLPSSLSLLLNCSDPDIFTNATACERETSWFDSLESNISFHCPFPLMLTKDQIKHTFGNGECGLQCKNPFLEAATQTSLHLYVAAMVLLSFLFNGSAFILMTRRWRSVKKYPDQCMLFINVCFLMSDIGWAIQFIPGERDRITCAEDGTERLTEPRHGESYGTCLVTFIFIYYFMMAAALWFMTMSYCWYRSFLALYCSEVKAKGFLKNYSIFFHVLAWVVPLLMTFIVVATSGIDGNNTTGVCFIGMRWVFTRVFLLLVPLVLVALVSGFFMVKGLLLLYRINTHKAHSLSATDKKNIRSTMLHIGSIAVLVCICIFISVSIHVHYYIYQSDYADLRNKFIECHLESAIRGEHTTTCLPDIVMDYETIELGAHLGLQFVAGIIFSTWVWRHNRLYSWAKIIKRKFKKVSVAIQKMTPAPPPTETTDGAVNHSFVPDVSSDPPPQISVEHSFDNLYDSVRSVREGSVTMREMEFGAAQSDGDSVFSSSTAVQENRLEHWQDRARDLRTERRKKSSVVTPSIRIVYSDGLIDNLSVEDNSVEVVMDPSPTPASQRQRRPGRVEFFKQGRTSMVLHSPVRSVSQTDMREDEFVNFAPSASGRSSGLQVPGRKISRIRVVSPVGLSARGTDSPDEGIDLERPREDGSRESLAGALPQLEIDSSDLQAPESSGDASNA